MGEGSKQTTEVKIYNQTYQVRSGNDPDYVKRLARHVDNRMTEVFEGTATVDSLKVAVLAALNIADDFFSTQQQLEALEDEIVNKSEQMTALLEPFDDPESA